jgi:hypothetical protein
MHRQELALCKRVLGKEYPDTLTSMSNLASVPEGSGQGRAGGRSRQIRMKV